MLSVRTQGQDGPWVFLLHWLGGSARTWTEISGKLSGSGYRVASIDLPGFGDAVSVVEYSVDAMSAAVIETIRVLRSVDRSQEVAAASWLLGAHSMGGKVAAVVARHAADGDHGLEGLEGLLLVSPSPPGPEPMPGDKREQLLTRLGVSTGDEDEDRARARSFLKDNTGKLPLTEANQALAENDLLRMNRVAFTHWLTEGSREDWAARVGVLPFPALILAGSEDAALSVEAQQQYTSPHFVTSEVVTMKGAGHLAPLERPGEVAGRSMDFAARLGVAPAPAPLGSSFTSLLESLRTSPRTRAVMQARLHLGEASTEQALGREDFLTLRALVNAIIPGASADLAVRLDQTLAFGAGDGWRYDTLPQDREAWTKGLGSLDRAAERKHGVPFLALPPEAQHDLLRQAGEASLGRGLLGAAGIGDAAHSYSAAEMKQWMEEVRGALAKLYMSDPRTMERVGFTGFADEAGFTQIQLGQKEEFER